MSASQAVAFAWRYLASARRSFFFMALAVLVASALAVLGPAVLGSFVNGVEGKVAAAVLTGTAVLFLLVTAAAQAVGALGATLAARVAWDATNALRHDLTKHVLGLDAAFHRAHQPGELIERIDADVVALAGLFSRMTVEVGGNALLVTGVIIALAVLDPVLGAAFFVLTVLTLAVLAAMGRRATGLFEAEREGDARYFGDLGEVLDGAEGLWPMGAQGYVSRRLRDRLREWGRAFVRAEVRGYVIWAVALVALAVGDVAAYGLTGRLYLIGSVPLGTVYAVVAYAALLAQPMDNLRGHFDDFQRALASLRRVASLFGEGAHRGEEGVRLAPGAVGVHLDHVHFAYPDAPDEMVLDDVSLTFGPGSHVALLGPSGAGKTSLGRIVARLETPASGTVQLGGLDLGRIAEASLRERVSYIGQDVRIFEGTLRDNLALFDASIPDARLHEALQQLSMSEWAKGRGGLTAAVSVRSLSAGEAQLIATARAFVKEPGLVVLDEPFARIEARTRRTLERAVHRLVEGRTALIIAHRVSTLSMADEVVVLEAGRMVERGSVPKLLTNADGHLARLLALGLEEAP